MDFSVGGYQGSFLFDIWFASKRSAEAAIDVSADIIGMVKRNTKRLCKNTIKNLTKDWTGGYYLIFKRKSAVRRYRILITIGYTYNMCVC